MAFSILPGIVDPKIRNTIFQESNISELGVNSFFLDYFG